MGLAGVYSQHLPPSPSEEKSADKLIISGRPRYSPSLRFTEIADLSAPEPFRRPFDQETDRNNNKGGGGGGGRGTFTIEHKNESAKEGERRKERLRCCACAQD